MLLDVYLKNVTETFTILISMNQLFNVDRG